MSIKKKQLIEEIRARKKRIVKKDRKWKTVKQNRFNYSYE